MDHLAYVDFTLKARLTNRTAVEQALLAEGFAFVGTDDQEDTYFAVGRGKLKHRRGSIENVITHYERTSEQGAEKTLVYRYNERPTAEMVKQLHASHRPIGKVSKRRRIYRKPGLKVHLDALPDGQEFIEIESFAHRGSASLAELRRSCHATRTALGIATEELVPTGYHTA